MASCGIPKGGSPGPRVRLVSKVFGLDPGALGFFFLDVSLRGLTQLNGALEPGVFNLLRTLTMVDV